MQIESYSHSIMIDKELCTGCVLCTLACPMGAIRVKNNKAEVFKETLCIDCGECLRVCPEKAVKSMTSKGKDLTGFKYLVALPSPVLYSQFRPENKPNDILLALQKIGFNYVYDQAIACEMVLAAYDEYLKRNQSIRPMISNFCPAVVMLISKNYPNLVKHIIPIEVPREVAAKESRKKIVQEHGISPEEIGIFHITPCAAKMISITNPIGGVKSELDGAISIRYLYMQLMNALSDIDEDEWILTKSSGVGISWALGSSSIRGLPNHHTFAIEGVKDVIQILDDIESGKHKDVDYLECSICPGGCIGGPLVVQNKHLAKSLIENLVEQYGVRSRIDPRKVLKQYDQLFFLKKPRVDTNHPEPLDTDITRALEKMNKIDDVLSSLPGKQCGACGAPTCQALAEDIISGDAKLTDCVFMKIKELENAIKRDSE